MRVLSLWRPWPWAIFDPVADKGIENRSWPPPVDLIGHQIALQSAQKWDDGAITMFLRLGITHFPNRKDAYPSGVITGVGTLDRVVTTSNTLSAAQERWFMGEYGWVLTDRVGFTAPVVCKGGQGLRYLSDEQEAQVRQQLARELEARQ